MSEGIKERPGITGPSVLDTHICCIPSSPGSSSPCSSPDTQENMRSSLLSSIFIQHQPLQTPIDYVNSVGFNLCGTICFLWPTNAAS